MRSAWFVGLVVLAGVAGPLACGKAFTSLGSGGASPSSGSETSTGGSTTSETTATTTTATSTSTTGTSTSTGSGGCTIVADCPGETTLCGTPTCLKGKCETLARQEDGKSLSQAYGDCQDIMCTKGQVVLVKNDKDFYDDGNECTDDACINGESANTPRETGASCGAMGSGKICDGAGACAVCTDNQGCMLPSACHQGLCTPDTCTDGKVTTGTETDKDCGGVCGPCSEGKYCVSNADCETHLCVVPSGQSKSKCVGATCTDGVKNGNEPTKDCGGPDCTLKCEKGDHCVVPSDCASLVCVGGVCADSSCADAVKNGNETGVDCGANCPQCP